MIIPCFDTRTGTRRVAPAYRPNPSGEGVIAFEID
jgi:hypothetical protein